MDENFLIAETSGKTPPLLSAIVITFNNYEELIRTLNSIPRLPDLEIIVVNGGTCPRTRAYLENFDRGVSLSEGDRGISDAFNKGFALSTGKYFVYLNSGDLLINANYWEEAVQRFENDRSLDFTYSDIVFDHDQIGAVTVTAKPLDYPGMPFCHQTLITRRSSVRYIPLFDESLRFAMDFDFLCKNLLPHAAQSVHFPIATVLMDGKGASSTHPLQVYSEYRAILKKYALMTPGKSRALRTIELKTRIKLLMKALKLHSWVAYLLRKKHTQQP